METAATPEATSRVGMSDNARRALTVGGLGAAALAFSATAASAADTDALSLIAEVEQGAVTAFTVAAKLPFISGIKNAVVQTFLSTSLKQHTEAVAELVKAGATKPPATLPTSVLTGLGLDKASTLTDAGKVITFAIALEGTIVATCSAQSKVAVSSKSRQLINQIGVSAGQRQAILRAVGALVTANALDLVALPPDAAKLPMAAGSIGFPDAYAKTTSAIAGA